MERIDYRKVYDEVYRPADPAPGLVLVPPMHFLMLDGRGAPGPGSLFEESAETLLRLARTLAAMIRRGPMALGLAVMPLERVHAGTARDGDWTLMIMQPPVISGELVHEAKAELHRRDGLPRLPEVRFEHVDGGPAVQLVHQGAFHDFETRLEELCAFAAEQGLNPRGAHQEIFVADPTREPAGKTILRQPVGA